MAEGTRGPPEAKAERDNLGVTNSGPTNSTAFSQAPRLSRICMYFLAFESPRGTVATTVGFSPALREQGTP